MTNARPLPLGSPRLPVSRFGHPKVLRGVRRAVAHESIPSRRHSVGDITGLESVIKQDVGRGSIYRADLRSFRKKRPANSIATSLRRAKNISDHASKLKPRPSAPRPEHRPAAAGLIF